MVVPEPTEHHLDERVVSSPISLPFSYAYIAACNQANIAFLQIASERGVALLHTLTYECKEETYALTEKADIIADQAPQYLIPLRQPVVDNFHPLDVYLRQHTCAWKRHVVYASRWSARNFLTSRKARLNALVR